MHGLIFSTYTIVQQCVSKIFQNDCKLITSTILYKSWKILFELCSVVVNCDSRSHMSVFLLLAGCAATVTIWPGITQPQQGGAHTPK